MRKPIRTHIILFPAGSSARFTAAMQTLILQTLSAPLPLLFGILALAVARAERRGHPRHLRAWKLTTFTFLLLGACSSLQGGWAVWAYLSGAGTDVYTEYLRWAAAGNTSRYVLMIAFGGAFTWLVLDGRRGTALGPLLPVVLSAAFVLGGVIGWGQGPLETFSRHAQFLAVLDLVEMVSLVVALLVSLTRAAVGRLLWCALAAYTLREPFNVGLLSALAHAGREGSRVHPNHLLHLVAILTFTVMITIAARSLALAREGVEVPAILERRHTRWRSLAD